MSDPAPTPTQPHPSLEVLARYRRGDLSPSEVESIQDHMVTCSQCCDAMLDLADLANPDPPSDPAHWDAAKTASWEKLRASVLPEETSASVMSFQLKPAPSPSRSFGLSRFAAAAMVTLSLMLGGLIAFLLLGTSGESSELAQARKELEERNRVLDGVQSQVAGLEAELEKMRSPWLNVEEFNLFPRGFVRGGPDSAKVSVPDGPALFTLTLNLLDTGQDSQFRLKVLAMDGSEFWAVEGLKKSRLGSISIALPDDFLAPGHYELRLEGQSGGEPGGEEWRLVAEYDLEVNGGNSS
ncbi:MAG: hypothetical protein K0U98_18120 [Deltaproteobacteria bacterium]|nr:hypothetical protein [Deltaproteobacteria bacterium]